MPKCAGTAFYKIKWHIPDDGLASIWLAAGCDKPTWCHGCDLNRDGAVDFDDFADFGAAWRETWP